MGFTCTLCLSNNKQTRISRVTVREFAALFSDETFEILEAIQKYHPKTLSELAVITGKQKSNLSRKLKTLAMEGIVSVNKGVIKMTIPFSQAQLNLDVISCTKPTVVSLFSGCGGLDLGFKNAGFDIVFANDIEPSVKDTYEKNLGHEILIQDIRSIDKVTAIPSDVDIVLAGIPCQPFSNAGKRGAMTDDRGTLFEQVMEVIDLKSPKIVLFENVRGFLSSKDDKGQPMPERIREELQKHGYELTYKLLNASDYEVPQNRFRVVLVGVREDIVAKQGQFKFPEPFLDKSALTVGNVIKDSVLKDEPQEVWQLSPQARALCLHIPAGGSWKNVPTSYLPDRLKKIRENMAKYHSPNFYRRFNVDEIMGTITAAATPENSGIIHPLEDRRYSVREIARFQSFPDDFKFINCPISKKYKMIGNAVPPKLGLHIAMALKHQFFKGTE